MNKETLMGFETSPRETIGEQDNDEDKLLVNETLMGASIEGENDTPDEYADEGQLLPMQGFKTQRNNELELLDLKIPIISISIHLN